jgi:molybdenum cofactor cytidylyltransferase
MKFGTLRVIEAKGAILAHAVKLDTVTLKKGRLLSHEDVEVLRASGIAEVIAAKLSVDDVPEDVAAKTIANLACGTSVKAQEAFTGRANLYTAAAGLVVLDDKRLQAINHLHESLTIATLQPFARVEVRAMVATVKVIPFAVPQSVFESALKIIGDEPLVKVAAFQNLRVGLIITQLPQTKDSLIAKSESAMRERIKAMGAQLNEVCVCDHSEQALATEIKKLKSDVILLFGSSAIVDRADVVPAALVKAGGIVQHIGMPVDPGNLLMLGQFENRPVIGVPSCARSPKVNGFDWVLERVMAGIAVFPSDLMGMGIGGLLAEIPSRPSPREQKTKSLKAPRIAALVLAAGKSSRMGSNKLLEDLNGQPMIAQTVQRIAASQVEKIMVVTGHQADKIQAALAQMPVSFVHNAHYSEGLATSLRAGVSALQNNYDAILICLGDMPLVDARDINRMIAGFNSVEHRSIVVPIFERTFGNPVLWGAEHFSALLACEGDRGARGLLEKLKDDVVEITIDNQSVVLDADTPEALATIRSIANSSG